MNTLSDVPVRVLTSTEERALALLGDGIPAETVAASLGLTPGRISQLVSDEYFSAKLIELKYRNLQAHTARDKKIDSLEDTVLAKIEETIPLVYRPMELTRMFQTLNGAKRRGSSTPESITEKQTVISLVMPVQIIQKFAANINNQVTTVGDKPLITMQSGTLAQKLEEQRRKVITNGNEHDVIDTEGGTK